MDFLDPEKQKRHNFMLYLGYVLIGIAVMLATIIFVYMVYGFTLDRNGQVMQNGLVFFSSAPEGAKIYLNGEQYDKQTNTRASLSSGQYTVRIVRDGYRTWQRSVTVEGGSVGHFDYPFLFPNKIEAKTKQSFQGDVTLATQSRDRRWVLVGRPDSFTTFTLFDVRDPKKTPTAISISPDLLQPGDNTQKWELVEWSTDNRHVLLKHVLKDNSEYILLDRQKPEESVNLTQTLRLTTQTPSFIDGKYDKFYLYDLPTQTLQRTSLEDTRFLLTLSGVLDFKPHGDDTILYATLDSKDPTKVQVRLRQGDKSYTIRTVSADATYMLDLAQYEDDWFIVAGAPKESRVYVYKNPVDDLKRKPGDPLVPIHVLKVTQPSDVSFSANSRFILAQKGQEFYVYDAENDKGYLYTASLPIDAPQPAATWMDGHRLTYVSGGKLVVFDFDSINRQTLVAADSRFLPFFDPSFRYVYVMNKTDGVQSALQNAALRTAQDL